MTLEVPAPSVTLRLEERGPRHPNAWGTAVWVENLTLSAIERDTGTEHILFQGNWELDPLLEWLSTMRPHLGERPLITQRSGETIGQTLCRAYDAVTEDLDLDLMDLAGEALYQYNSKHNISFGAAGMADFPMLLVGKGERGIEICNWIYDLDEDEAWRFLFDLDDFYEHLPRL